MRVVVRLERVPCVNSTGIAFRTLSPEVTLSSRVHESEPLARGLTWTIKGRLVKDEVFGSDNFRTWRRIWDFEFKELGPSC
jgi:hypothetical protein